MDARRQKILIVDDDPASIRLLGHSLDSYYDIIVATDGFQAMGLLEQNLRPDLILLDRVMPNCDGFQFLKALENDYPCLNIPVILITAKDSNESETEGFNLGAVDFISKPFSPSITLARIQTHLKLHHQKAELLQRQQEIENSEALLRATLNSTKDGIIVFDENFNISVFNQPFIEMWAFPQAVMESANIKTILSYGLKQLVDGNSLLSNIDNFLKSNTAKDQILEFKDGRVYSQHITPIQLKGKKLSFVASYADISDFKKIEAELKKMSLTDSLTGLDNRRRMDQILIRECHRARRYKYNIGLLIIDIDNFKSINDRYGHEAGDRVLQNIAKPMKDHFRKVDYCCRYGGDEFVVIMTNTTIDGMVDAGQRLIEIYRNSLTAGMEVSISIGAASTKDEEGNYTPETLFSNADTALYKAKENGRDRMQLFSENQAIPS